MKTRKIVKDIAFADNMIREYSRTLSDRYVGRDAVITIGKHKGRTGQVASVKLGSGGISFLIYIYRRVRIDGQWKHDTLDLLNSEGWTRQYWRAHQFEVIDHEGRTDRFI